VPYHRILVETLISGSVGHPLAIHWLTKRDIQTGAGNPSVDVLVDLFA
jgi:hypothetical protein